MSAPVEVGMRHVYFFITDCVLLESQNQKRRRIDDEGVPISTFRLKTAETCIAGIYRYSGTHAQ